MTDLRSGAAQSTPAELTSAQRELQTAEAAKREAASREAMQAVLVACDHVLRERVEIGDARTSKLDANIADLSVGAIGG